MGICFICVKSHVLSENGQQYPVLSVTSVARGDLTKPAV